MITEIFKGLSKEELRKVYVAVLAYKDDELQPYIQQVLDVYPRSFRSEARRYVAEQLFMEIAKRFFEDENYQK